jgi:hypothetical protein
VQAQYRFHTRWFDVAPGYRFAEYQPWAGDVVTSEAGVDLSAFRLRYQTIGLRFWHPTLPMQLFINYTFTGEEASRTLSNDRLEILTQVAF